MDPARYQQLKKLYAAAIELSGEERVQFVGVSCGDDAEMRAELERLLDAGSGHTGNLIPEIRPPPPPDRFAHYDILSELGFGGMGVVYRARDDRTGDVVALKLPHPHLIVSPKALERFVQEGKIGRQVDHENVVRTFEAGSEEGRAYLAMELVEGRTLRALLESLGRVPERLLREIGMQTARGLAAVHTAGIIHRDLKPENILLTSDQRVRIMDLGIAKLQEAGPLTQEGQFMGSLPYAAPEQCDLREVGPASDLYALGVVLLELATGENPFRHSNPAATIRAQLEHMPRPPTVVSPFLREVIVTLLSKRSELRFASAAELAALLEEGEDSTWWRQRAAHREQARASVPVAHATALYGRHEVLARLTTLWEEKVSDHGASVLMEGEPGIGKSRVVAELIDGVGENAHVLYGSFPPDGQIEGLRALVLSRFGHARLEEELPRFLTRSRHLADTFVEFVRQGTTQDDLPIPALETIFAELLESLAADMPTMAVLEDLHFASAAARRVAFALARAADRCGALVVLTARPGGAPGFGGETLALERLAPEEVAAMVAESLGSPMLGAQLAGLVVARTDGIPFFVLEMLRALWEQGFVARDDDGRTVLMRDPGEFAPTEAVRDLVRARIAHLEADERSLLDVAAVQGFVFDAELVADVLGRPLVRVLQDLAAVERGAALVRGAGRRYRFDHHQVQEVLYTALPDRLRAEYHALLAEAYGRAPREELSQADALFLASHHLRGSRPEQGLPHLGPALDYYDRRHLNAEAADLVGAALSQDGLVEGEERFDLLQRRIGYLSTIRDLPSELEALRALKRLARSIGTPQRRAQTQLRLGAFYGGRGRLDSAGRAYDKAIAILADVDDDQLYLSALSGRATVHWRQARNDEAIRILDEAIAKSRAIGSDKTLGMALINYALVQKDLGHFAEAVPLLGEALELARRVKDKRMETVASGNLGLSAWSEGRWEDATRHLKDAMAIARETGDRRMELTGTGNLGLVEFDQGKFDEALAAFEEQGDVARILDDQINLMHSLIDEGWTRIHRGEFELARARLDEALALARKYGVPRIEGHALLRLGRLARREHEPDKARAFGEQALQVLEEQAQDRGSGTTCHIFLGRLAAAQGDLDEAEKSLRTALRIGGELGNDVTRLRALAQLAVIGREPRDEADRLWAEWDGRVAWMDAREIRDALGSILT
ncbi:MAG: serine/threonine-protein kinase [Planctomycetota bacterium]